MTFLEIEAFLKITETGSFSAAAEALYVTQPALGRRIRAAWRRSWDILFLSAGRASERWS